MRYLATILVSLLTLIILVTTNFHASQQRPIDNLLDDYRSFWPGNHNNNDQCVEVVSIEGANQQICWLSDTNYFLSNDHVIQSLQLTPDNIRLGDGIIEFGTPDIHIDNREYHFLKWTMPPVTLVARSVQGNWLMGEVDAVYLRYE